MAESSRYAVAVQEVVRRAVHPELALQGFRKRSSTYRRTVGPCVQLINFQSSAFQVMNARFTINVGVDFPERYKVGVGLLCSPGPAWVCAASQRIGQLMSPPHDHWWALAPAGPRTALESALLQSDWSPPDGSRPIDAVVAEVREVVRAYALPWLSEYADPRKVLLEYGGGRDGIVLALMLGDVPEAQRIAAEYLREVPTDELAREWAQERGLLR